MMQLNNAYSTYCQKEVQIIPWMILSAVPYLDVFVVFPEVHQMMVSLDGFREVSDVSAHSDIVLPDLPVLVVTLQGFLQSTKGFFSANEGDKNTQTDRQRKIEK